MSSNKSGKTEVQKGLIALRQRAGLTQLQLALLLGLTPVTTARWEPSHPPHGQRLDQLRQLAEERGAPDLADIFRTAFEREAYRKRLYEQSLQEADESVDLETAIRHAYGTGGSRLDRIVKDLIFILHQKIRDIQGYLAERDPLQEAQLDLTGAPSRQVEAQELVEIEELRDLIRRLEHYQREKRADEKAIGAARNKLKKLTTTKPAKRKRTK